MLGPLGCSPAGRATSSLYYKVTGKQQTAFHERLDLGSFLSQLTTQPRPMPQKAMSSHSPTGECQLPVPSPKPGREILRGPLVVEYLPSSHDGPGPLGPLTSRLGPYLVNKVSPN